MRKAWVLLLVVAILPAPLGAEELAKPRVVTFKGNVAKCLAPVEIKMIDGKLRQLPTMGFTLEPGLHRLAGNAVRNSGHCPKVKCRSRKPLTGFPAVEWLFEPGMVYYIALDHHYPNEEEWRLVVWKVKTEDGELVFDITGQETKEARLH